MIKIKIIYYVFISLLLLSTVVKGQVPNSKILHEKFSLHNLANSAPALFLHTDKSIYMNNEKIWFSAYLLDTYVKTKDHKILSIALIERTTRRVAITEKVMIEDGKSNGYLILPDTIPPGNYELFAYTNLVNRENTPSASFKYNIKIKNITQHLINTKLTLLDSTPYNGEIRIKVTIDGLQRKLKAYPVITYQLGSNQTKTAIAKTGEMVISIAAEKMTSDHPELFVTTKYQQQIQYRSLTLPKAGDRKIKIRFFPEGGQLAEGLVSTVAWECRTEQGEPIAITGFLLKDSEVVGEVRSNNYGAGIFKLRNDRKSVYTLKIPAGRLLDKDTILKLPSPSQLDLTLHVAKAVVRDTISFDLFTTKEKMVQILLHDDQGAYLLLNANLTAPFRTFNISLANFSEGLTMLTVLDVAGKPLAERVFFAHYDRLLSPLIRTDKIVYNKKDSVKLKVHIVDKTNSSVSGIFSIAAVHNSRLLNNSQQLADYFYLKRHLNDVPSDPTGKNIHNQEYLEHVLLIRGWRRYTWPDVLKTTTADTINKYMPFTFKGSVTRHGQPLKKPVQVVVLGGKKTVILTTGKDGSFLLDPSSLIVNQRKNLLLKVAGSKINYEISVSDPTTAVNRALGLKSMSNNDNGQGNIQLTKDEELNLSQSVIHLQAVEVKAPSEQTHSTKFKGEPGPNACGDYVSYNGSFAYLNYEGTNEWDKVKPVPGTWYFKRTDLQGSYFKVEPVFYYGCTDDKKSDGLSIQGVYEDKEHYLLEKEDVDMPYYSTLYWGAGLMTDQNGDIDVNFATGDLLGDFQIVLEGITQNGVVSAKASFSVK